MTLAKVSFCANTTANPFPADNFKKDKTKHTPNSSILCTEDLSSKQDSRICRISYCLVYYSNLEFKRCCYSEYALFYTTVNHVYCFLRSVIPIFVLNCSVPPCNVWLSIYYFSCKAFPRTGGNLFAFTRLRVTFILALRIRVRLNFTQLTIISKRKILLFPPKVQN